MARLAVNFPRLADNIKKAAVRIYIYGVLTIILLVVIIGTALTLRLGFKQVAIQYESNIERNLQRIEYEFNSLDGRISLANINTPAPNSEGIPIFIIPLEYMSIIPGHVEDIKPLLGCSYSSQSYTERACAGILKNKSLGSIVYIRGKFSSSKGIISPEKIEIPTSGHHFVITISARNKEENYIITFDPVQRTTNSSLSYLSPAWSLTGFKAGSSSLTEYSREAQIKGRVLKTSLEEDSSQYEFIFQVPAYIFSEDIILSSKDSGYTWPPKDIKNARLRIKLIEPNANNIDKPLLDSALFKSEPDFSFNQMKNYILPGEKLIFSTPNGENNVTHDIATSYAAPASGYLMESFNHLSDILIKISIPSDTIIKKITLLDGTIISLRGDASSVLSEWREAARSNIAFSLILIILLLLSLIILWGLVLNPLYRVRRNTLHMKERLNDGGEIKLPFKINESASEVGVLWSSILGLHQTLTSFRNITIERTKKERDLLKAIGHEIRSPLQNLVLRHTKSDDPDTRDLRRISFAVQNLFSTYNSGSENIDNFIRTPKDIFSRTSENISIEDVSEFLRNATESSIKNITFNGCNDSLTVFANGDMLEAVLTAIISNANDFRTEGSKIDLNAYVEKEEVVITIRNYGPTIPTELMDEIFEYGVSIRDTKTPGEHLGQGLNLAKSYITNMSGSITARNIDGGVEFEIRLIKAKTE